MSDQMPSEPPPSYQQATGSRTNASAPTSSHPAASRLDVPGRNGIPASHRRSMEDEARPLPKGWVRSFDPSSSHQFFVDTTQDPPRSIWTHPYDDEQYLSTVSSAERERIQQESMHPHPSKADIMADHTDEEDDDHHHHAAASSSHAPNELPPRPDAKGDKGKGKDTRGFGRKMKDKLTGSTHEERELERKRRAEEEARLYKQHLLFRQAMAKAMETGQPQLVGKDKNGKDVYVEPPAYGGGSYGGGGYGYSPYSNGMYSTPNARYVRPAGPYGRPYGGGFGGGYGMPLAMGMGGGLMGGLLLGDMMGGGMGGGFGGGFGC